MATSKKIKVRVRPGRRHVTSVGAKPGDEFAQGIVGKTAQGGEEIEVTEAELEAFGDKFEVL